MSNAQLRGQEATIRVTVDGNALTGSWLKVKDFTVTPQTDIIKENYLGEYQPDGDRMHNGFDLSFSIDMRDREVMDFISRSIQEEENQLGCPNVTINVIYAFRDGSDAVGETYFDVVMKVADQSFGGRTEYISYSIEAYAKRRSVLELG